MLSLHAVVQSDHCGLDIEPICAGILPCSLSQALGLFEVEIHTVVKAPGLATDGAKLE